MDSENGGEHVKLGMGITLQLVAVLVAIGIAWGTLSAKQNAMENAQRDLMNSNGAVLTKLDDIQNRLMRLEYSIRKDRAGR
jgi:hypothetical protein